MTFEEDLDPMKYNAENDLYDLMEDIKTDMQKGMSLRCDKVGLEGKYERGKCVEVQEWAVGEIILQIENDQDLYYKLFTARGWNKMLQQTRGDTTPGEESGAAYWCEKAFRPNAEAELRQMKEKTGDQAKDIANSLFVPFVEQYLEAPVQERRDKYNKCIKAVDAAIAEFDRSIRKRVGKK